MASKSVNLFLLDGTATGRIKCTLQNWTGVSYKIPRKMLEACKVGGQIATHMKQTGIYFLLGENSDGNQVIYVGQACVRKNGEGLLLRLLEHKKNEKENYWNDWNEAIVFTTQNNSLGQTEISYLENRFTSLANDAGRYIVKNGNEPTQGHITEEKESEMEEFIGYARITMGILGHKVFEPLVTVKEEQAAVDEESNTPVFSYKGKFDARGVITNEGFVLLKGSRINPVISKSCSKAAVSARHQYAQNITEDYALLADIPFTSPSAAANFVSGSSASGNVFWATEDGKKPKDFGM